MLPISNYFPWFFTPVKVAVPCRQKLLSPQEVIDRLINLQSEDSFFQTLPQQIESFDLKTLNALVLAKNPTFISAVDHAAKQPVVHQNTVVDKSVETSLLFRFFFNIVDTFASALNFYDESNPPSSIYEKQVLIMIYYRFFQIPFALSLLLQPVVLVAWKAYLVAMAILAAVSALIYVHLKWFRPFPTIIPCCEMNKDLVKKEYQKPISGLETETESLISYLNRAKTKPVMVLGATGSGKTTLLHKLQQRINGGQVPQSLKNKKIVTINGGMLMAKSQAGFGDKLKQIKYALSGFENQTIVHIDELQAVAKNGTSFELMKEFLRTPGLQFVTSTTWDAFNKEIIPADNDHSFRRSFGSNYISIKKWEPLQVETILEEMAFDAWDVPFSDDALKKIIELTDQNLQDLPQPAKAIELMEKVIDESRNKYEAVQPEELKLKKAELSRLESKRIRNLPLDKPDEKLQRDLLSKEIEVLEKSYSELVKKRSFVHSLMAEKNKLKKQLMSDTQALQKGNTTELTQKRYLFYYFFLLPELMKLIEEKVISLDLQVNSGFVNTVFKDYKKKKESVHIKKANPLDGLIKNPSQSALDEVKKAFDEVANLPHGGGKPTFNDILKARWAANEKIFKNDFGSYDIYQEAVCKMCDAAN